MMKTGMNHEGVEDARKTPALSSKKLQAVTFNLHQRTVELQSLESEKSQHASQLSREALTDNLIELVSKLVKVLEFLPTLKLAI